MLDTIYVGMTGLSGFSRGLKVIANNTANMNTVGFKGSSLKFSDLFYTNSGGAGSGQAQFGHGLNTGSTALNFKQGELRQTGESLDLAMNGQGLFVLKDESGNVHFTRAGQFKFNANGVLVSSSDGLKVMGMNDSGQMVEIGLDGLRTNPGQVTKTITFNGNLSSATATQTVSGLKVYDAAGGLHELSLVFTSNSSVTAGSWTVDLMDGTSKVGSSTMQFSNGIPDAASGKLSFSYTPAGLATVPFTVDFSKDVTSYSSGSLSTLAVSTQDGYAPGGLTEASFNNLGQLVLTYANGQTAKGPKLMLARVDTSDALEQKGGALFDVNDERQLHFGSASSESFGAVQSGSLEQSNVDLTQEFGDMVIVQRGYQASSQVISTANEMLQELYGMKGK